MKLLLIHQNMPGQFQRLLAQLRSEPGHQIVCVSQRQDFNLPDVSCVTYQPLLSVLTAPNGFLAPLEAAVRNGLPVMQFCQSMLQQGFTPDLIIAHPGWGESLYVKQIFPNVPLLHYCEYFYHVHGGDTNFDPANQQSLEANCVTQTRNAALLLGLETCDHGISPTHWQKSRHPAGYQDKISVIFDGIDTQEIQPNPAASFTLPDGTTLRPGDEVVTFVARSLEPYRGFPSFMGALPRILRDRPQARVVILGGDGVSYGRPPANGGTWRETMLREVPVDLSRVHFMGLVEREVYLRLLQVSAAHVYLTVPFVLSWSMMEAMAAGCVIIGSDTAPVQEVLTAGENGVLVDFFDPDSIAAAVVGALSDPAGHAALRAGARRKVIESYDVKPCLAELRSLMQRMIAGERIRAQ